MNAKTYLDLQKKHQQELSEFPIAYAFSNEQLKEALKKLGATLDECVSYIGAGDVMKRTDVPAFKAMLIRHSEEVHKILEDETAAEEAFRYEMDNHEYAINEDGDYDVLGCFSLDWDKLQEMNLRRAYERARQAHCKHFENVW